MTDSPPDPFAHLRHDLRTPLNQIIGYAEMLREDAGEEGELSDDLAKIEKAGRSLLQMINERLVPGGVEAPAPAAAPPVSEVAPARVETTSPPTTPDGVTPARILVVDDNEMNRDVLARRLQRDGHQPEAVADGRQALKYLADTPCDLVLLDIMMPEIDGYEVLTRMKADEKLRHLPVIMISAIDEIDSVVRCIEAGADDYLHKPFNPTLLRARIGACLDKKRLRDQEQATHLALVESQRALAAELNEAADYVRSLLPEPIQSDGLRTAWEYLPSEQLGGDAFGYYWIDDDHFAVYLLDVCGHGVGAALLSVTILNVLRSQSLPNTDFRKPAAVLSALNRAFPMENQNNMYFTLWYGIYHRPRHQLSFASGGHPPAALLTGPSPDALRLEYLRTNGLIVGAFPEVEYEEATFDLEPFSRLYIYSDGVYELDKPDGEMLSLEEFAEHLHQSQNGDRCAEALAFSRSVQGRETFEDDFSLVELTLQQAAKP